MGATGIPLFEWQSQKLSVNPKQGIDEILREEFFGYGTAAEKFEVVASAVESEYLNNWSHVWYAAVRRKDTGEVTCMVVPCIN